jgi:glycosyltransferase involved in cell wall biosynthesis/cellulose synthase/poly-beta-1,6-N-acetylglucosamine synthase-like glycosyltransferase
MTNKILNSYSNNTVFDRLYYIYKKLNKELLVDIEIIKTNPISSSYRKSTNFEKNGSKYITYTNLDRNLSAFQTLTGKQKIFWSMLLGSFLFGFVINLQLFLSVFVGILTLIYVFDFIFTLAVIVRSFGKKSDIKFTNEELVNINDDELPIYTILCPLYKESQVIEQFTRAIEIIDWPKEKLEVVLLLEEDDVDTISKINSLNLPEYFKVEVVPHSLPKTKPKACNYGLLKARGEYLVVYDAEDKPDPMQLKKAYLAYKRLPNNVVCLQSKLNYYNQDQNLLTRLFTAEYSYWFDIALPGLQSMNTIIPLGGTSNHFKTNILKKLGGWDPFNVTEDCDLGTRLFKGGYKTAVIDSETLEEANSNLKSWLKQRSRWIKGYIQTYLVHTRKPVEFLLKYKQHAIIFQLIIGMRMVFMVINPIMWIMTVLYFSAYPFVGPFIESLYPWYVYYPAVFCLLFANFIYLYSYMVASAKKGKWELVRYVFLIPFYWILTSISAVRAFYQLITNPYYWEKTKHGLHLGQEANKKEFALPKVAVEQSYVFADLKIASFVENITSGLANILRKKVIDIQQNTSGNIFNRRIKIEIESTALSVNIASFFKLFSKLKISRPNGGNENILIFNWRDTKHRWQGGAEVYIQKIAEKWVKNGYGVTIFCGNDGNSKYDETVNGVNVVRRGGFFTVYLWAAIYYAFRLRNHFDFIVDCENGIPFFSPIYSSKPKVLLIHHVHQTIFRENLPLPAALLAMFLESKLMKYAYRNTKVVTVSQSSRDDIENLNLSDNLGVDIVNPGIEMNDFSKMEKYSVPTFSYLGRLMPYKNVDVLINAFEKVVKSVPNARLIIAGRGRISDSLKDLCVKLNISDSVEFKGFVDENEKREILAKSWMLVQPSSFEGWGITVTEANASSTPVIASDTAGLRDSILDGQTGVLVKTGDVNEMSRVMVALTEMDGFRSRISQNAYLWAQKFSWDDSAQKLLNIIVKETYRRQNILVPSYVYPENS